MVVVPAGEFTMGAPAAELGGEAQHRVRIEAPIAVSKFEITFVEWDACVAAGGCRGYRPGDEGWGRGSSPAMNISWEDAKAYAAWLGAKTGKEVTTFPALDKRVVALAFMPDAATLLAAGTRPIHWVSLAEGKKVGELQGHQVVVACLGFTPVGNLLASTKPAHRH